MSGRNRKGGDAGSLPKAAIPGTAVIRKVNRGIFSRCRLLRRAWSPDPKGSVLTQREVKVDERPPSNTRPSDRREQTEASVSGNVTETEQEQHLRASMAAATPPSANSGPASGPWPADGGPREAEGGPPREREEDHCKPAEDEELEGWARVPMRRSSRLRASIRCRSPFRRHSWEPGKRVQSLLEGEQERSVSLDNLEDDNRGNLREVDSQQGHDYWRSPIIQSTGELDFLLSLKEEEIEEEDLHDIRVVRDRTGPVSGFDEVVDSCVYHHLRTKDLINPLSEHCGDPCDREGTGHLELEPSGSKRVHRTVSFLKKMAGITKNKEKEKMKEREKEAKERETRITNGHHFNSITVSGNTLCFACNKSIIAKEAFICPNCSVTIHKSCKDSLSSCTKVKQKQLKAAQVKNNSALQSVSLRHKAPIGRERPNSAIYPSDSLRQSPLFSQLGSRRGRTAFQSLSKSVSTNNIGNLNDDTPLGIRRILSQSTDSLNMRNRTLSIESLIDEGAEVIYQQLMGDLDLDERYFEADSWSLAVDTSFLQQHKKDVMKRQDVIYELIQTEVHHVRTLKIMSDLFRKGMLEELQMDRSTVDTIFPALDDLIQCHAHFLSQLLERRKESLLSDSDKNFVINRLGDILVNQFSGQNAELMRRAYAEFCSRHTKAVKLYKELYTRDKRFQQFVRRMTRSSVLRRHGIQECILLVTQRITKYPVLVDRILLNTKGNEEDRRDLSNSLTLVKELISAVDQEVHECEKRYRLQDIYNRMDAKSVAHMHGGRQFRRDDLIRRKLVHDGFVLWKTVTGRFKDIQVLLLTDVLIFLHEKDQRYSFPVLDNKPSVIPLHKLIVRDIANQEKGMFLISAAAQTPEMYEIHTASKDERNTWMKVIQQSVNVCPEMDDFSIEMETKETLRELADEIQQRDRGITELLEERADLFLQVLQLRCSEDLSAESGGRRLFRSESNESPKGERLLTDAVKEVQCLSELMVDVCGMVGHSLSSSGVDQTPAPGGCEITSAPASTNCNSEQASVNGSGEVYRTDTITGGAQDRNGNQLQLKSHNEEILLRLSRVSALLHALQAIVVKQDSLLESQRQQLGDQRERLGRQNSRESPLLEQERARSAEKQREELAGLRRQHALLQEEFQRSRRACEERAQEQRALEARLQESERCRAALERALEESGRGAPPGPELARRRKKSHVRQFSLPSAQLSGLAANGQQDASQRRRSADETCLHKALNCEGAPNPWIAGGSHPEGPGCPWPEGQETPAWKAGEEEEEEEEVEEEEEEAEGTESGPGLKAGIQEGLLEEESEDEGESPPPSFGEEGTELGRAQDTPDSGDSDRPGPGGSETPADPHIEEEDDDIYY